MIPPDLLTTAKTLRDALPTIKSLTSSEQVQQAIIERRRFLNTIRDHKKHIRKVNTALEQDMRARAREFKEAQDATTALIDENKHDMTELESETAWLSVDIDELKNCFWDLRNAEREIHHGTNATHPSLQ